MFRAIPYGRTLSGSCFSVSMEGLSTDEMYAVTSDLSALAMVSEHVLPFSLHRLFIFTGSGQSIRTSTYFVPDGLLVVKCHSLDSLVPRATHLYPNLPRHLGR